MYCIESYADIMRNSHDDALDAEQKRDPFPDFADFDYDMSGKLGSSGTVSCSKSPAWNIC